MKFKQWIFCSQLRFVPISMITCTRHIFANDIYIYINFQIRQTMCHPTQFLDSKVHGANMGPTWVLLAPVGPHVGPVTLLSGLIHPVANQGTFATICTLNLWGFVHNEEYFLPDCLGTLEIISDIVKTFKDLVVNIRLSTDGFPTRIFFTRQQNRHNISHRSSPVITGRELKTSGFRDIYDLWELTFYKNNIC